MCHTGGAGGGGGGAGGGAGGGGGAGVDYNQPSNRLSTPADSLHSADSLNRLSMNLRAAEHRLYVSAVPNINIYRCSSCGFTQMTSNEPPVSRMGHVNPAPNDNLSQKHHKNCKLGACFRKLSNPKTHNLMHMLLNRPQGDAAAVGAHVRGGRHGGRRGGRRGGGRGGGRGGSRGGGRGGSRGGSRGGRRGGRH